MKTPPNVQSGSPIQPATVGGEHHPGSVVALLRGQALLLGVAVLAALFFLLTALVLQSDLKPTSWDISTTHELQEFPPFVRVPLSYVSAIGFAPWNWVLLAVVLGFMTFRRWFTEVAFTALAGAGGVIAEVIKNVIDRPRPTSDYAQIVKVLDSYSFPSGHVTGYVTLFGFLFYLAYTLLPRRSLWRWLILVATGLLVLLVGPSRVSMGQHWASDALAGYALGFAYLLVVIYFYRFWMKRHPKLPVKHETG